MEFMNVKIPDDILLLLSSKIRLKLKGKRQAVAFDVAFLGELQFIKPIISRYAERHPDDLLVILYNRGDLDIYNKYLGDIRNKYLGDIRNKIILINGMFRYIPLHEIDLFITSEQYNYGLNNVYSISIFHGLAAKGLSFTPEIVYAFDAFFLLGPIHRQAFDEFVKEFLEGKYPEHLDLFEVGYPKSDDLLNGQFSSQKILKDLDLDPRKKTILYAPAFNEGASLREFGIDIIESICNMENYNIIVKLPIDCWQPKSNLYATGGINWFEAIDSLQTRYPNLRLYHDYVIDPLLACSDVLITCISSVSFEFLALNKPVIYIDTPKYFNSYLKQHFPDKDTVAWADRTTVNGGHEFGLVVSDIQQLPLAIENVLNNPKEFPRQQERLKSYLFYNRGRGAEAAVSKIEELLNSRACSRRTHIRYSFMRSTTHMVTIKIMNCFKSRFLRLLNL